MYYNINKDSQVSKDLASNGICASSINNHMDSDLSKWSEFNPNRVSFMEFANMAKLPCTRVRVHQQYDVPRGAIVTFLGVIGMPKRYNMFLGTIADECVEDLIRFFEGCKDAAAIQEARSWYPAFDDGVGYFYQWEQEHPAPWGLHYSDGCNSYLSKMLPGDTAVSFTYYDNGEPMDFKLEYCPEYLREEALSHLEEVKEWAFARREAIVHERTLVKELREQYLQEREDWLLNY